MPIKDAKDNPHEAHPAANTDIIPVPNIILKLPRLLSILNLFITRVKLTPNKIPMITTNTMSSIEVAENEPKRIIIIIFNFVKNGYVL